MQKYVSVADRKAENLSAILGRLNHVRDEPDLAKVVPGDIQGIFLRRTGDHLEMYCYDMAEQKLSEVMSRVDVTAPLTLISPYAQAMMVSAFWQPVEPAKVYIAGFGGGRLAINMQHHFANCLFDGSDIDPNMLQVAQEWFGFAPCDRFDIVAADSREDLAGRSARYDIILLDVFFGGGDAANHLGTTEFFESCKTKLTQKGVVVANLIERDPLLGRKTAGLQSVFEHCIVWEHYGTHMVFASREPSDLQGIRNRIRAFEKENGSGSNLFKQSKLMRPSKPEPDEIPLSDSDVKCGKAST